MFLVNNPNIFTLHRQFKHRQPIIPQQVYGNRPAKEMGKPFPAKSDILFRLYDAMSVFCCFCLNGNNKLPPPPVNPDIQLVNLYLANT